jgi:uncharacterized membrane protein
MKKEVKILYLMLFLLWANVFVFIIYLSLSERTKTTNKAIIKIKTKHTRKQIEDLVELTKDTGHLNYINNDCLGCEN